MKNEEGAPRQALQQEMVSRVDYHVKASSAIPLRLVSLVQDLGFLQAIGGLRLQTLLILANLADEHGIVALPQSELAQHLGIRRDGVSRRLGDLVAFEWQGTRLVRAEGGRFNVIRYCLLVRGGDLL